jgi:hypothetical protein
MITMLIPWNSNPQNVTGIVFWDVNTINVRLEIFEFVQKKTTQFSQLPIFPMKMWDPPFSDLTQIHYSVVVIRISDVWISILGEISIFQMVDPYFQRQIILNHLKSLLKISEKIGVRSGKHTKSYWTWPIEFVDFSIKNGGSFLSFLYVYQRVPHGGDPSRKPYVVHILGELYHEVSLNLIQPNWITIEIPLKSK